MISASFPILARSVLALAVAAVASHASAPLAAQQSAGPLPGMPAALSVAASATGGLSTSDLLFKGVGFTTTPPTSWPNGPGPALDLDQILASLGATGLDIDALSAGFDWVPADNQGNVLVPVNQWAALSFSVSRTSSGRAGSKINAELVAGSPVGGDLFTFVLPGSAMPPPLVATTERMNDAREMGMGDVELDAVDHFLPIYSIDRRLSGLMSPTPRIFFSVSNASIPQVPSAWWAGTPRSGATVFELTRSPFGGWAQPTPFVTYRHFGLDQSEDLDALAVDLVRHHILYSTTGTRRDQLLFYHDAGIVSFTALPIVYTDPVANRPVSTEIGLAQSDELDAICAMDPSVRSNGAAVNVMYFFTGTPRPPALPRTPAIASSAFRMDGPGGERFRTFMIGWPPITGAGPGVAAVLATVGNTTSPTYPLGPLFARNPAPVFAGDPLFLDLLIPPSMAITGFDATLRWFAVDGAITELAEAWPTLVHF